MASAKGSRAGATAGGLAALAIWSMTVALVRGATESLGTLTAAALAMGAGGVLSLAAAWAAGRSPAAMLRLPRKYLLVCGGLFVVYEVCVWGAIGWAANRSTVLVVGLANYLWPALTVVLSVPILGRRARWALWPGCVLAVAGAAAATLGRGGLRWEALSPSGGVAAPVGLAAAGAVAWGMYSNLVKRWGRPEAGAVPLFLLASAGALAALRLGRAETTVWTGRAAGELAFLAVAQSAAAYVLWEWGMRRGNHLLLGLTSYFLPVASTAIAAAYLAVLPGPWVMAGAVLVAAGAVICKLSLAEPAGTNAEPAG